MPLATPILATTSGFGCSTRTGIRPGIRTGGAICDRIWLAGLGNCGCGHLKGLGGIVAIHENRLLTLLGSKWSLQATLGVS